MRASGVLMHITSLPSNYGVGCLCDVDKFIRLLQKSKQKYWQILPINATNLYNGGHIISAFAGDILLIDLEQLVDMGLVEYSVIANSKRSRGMDYQYALDNKQRVLGLAFEQFIKDIPPRDYTSFVEDNEYWLGDYALFCSVKEHFGGASWMDWGDEFIRMRRPSSIEHYSDMLFDRIEYHKFCQYIFFLQWGKFTRQLDVAGIRLIGNVSMYVHYDSADVWSNSHLFQLTKDRRPYMVVDNMSDKCRQLGQVSCYPVYNYKAMDKDNYNWWMQRIAHCDKLYNVIQLDRFRDYDSYYCYKFGSDNTRLGKWHKGAGYSFLGKVLHAFANLDIIVDDTVNMSNSAIQLRDKCNFAGKKVLQLAFDGNSSNTNLTENYAEHSVAYMGQEYVDSTLGWWNSLDGNQQFNVLQIANLDSSDNIVYRLMEMLLASNADLVILSMQDITCYEQFGNMPKLRSCNNYMATNGDLSMENANRLAELTVRYNRHAL